MKVHSPNSPWRAKDFDRLRTARKRERQAKRKWPGALRRPLFAMERERRTK